MTMCNAVECQKCKAIWQVSEGQNHDYIPSKVVEKLILINCPLCCSIATKIKEVNP